MSDNKILKNILKKYGGVLMSHGSNTPILTHTMTNIATSVSTYHPQVKTDAAIFVTMGVKNGVFDPCDKV